LNKRMYVTAIHTNVVAVWLRSTSEKNGVLAGTLLGQPELGSANETAHCVGITEQGQRCARSVVNVQGTAQLEQKPLEATHRERERETHTHTHGQLGTAPPVRVHVPAAEHVNVPRAVTPAKP
jgi:hypothetical protein